jgi:hypothetical protein
MAEPREWTGNRTPHWALHEMRDYRRRQQAPLEDYCRAMHLHRRLLAVGINSKPPRPPKTR